MNIGLLCAGSNAYGQLSTGGTEDRHRFSSVLPGLPTNTKRILSVSCGANHTLVLLETLNEAGSNSTELWGCGDGRRGQLGPSYDKDGGPWTTLRPIDLDLKRQGLDAYTLRLASTSWETSYLVLSTPGKDDVLLSMGSNDYGDLGVGIFDAESQKSQACHEVRFNHVLGSEWAARTIRIEALATGLHHVIALLGGDDSRRGIQIVAGWGMSRHGQLGHATNPPIRSPAFISIPCLVASDAALGRVIAAGLGHQHTALLHDSGRVTALGSNRKGQLAGIERWRDVKSVGCTWNGTYAVVQRSDQTHILACGDNRKGQLGYQDGADSSIPSPFTSVTHRLLNMACGSEHVLCLFETRASVSSDWSDQSRTGTEVWGWGWNEHGNLGLGNTEDVPQPVKIWPPRSEEEESAPDGKVLSIWAGCATSWIAVDR
ncbi:RCC1/BLIP-II protein [Gloeophyllum trabeum ATCC 11539]|uniref:RCC1/BLIP-II protein n=1 Tax=Gloeophyllum trabeum (strain ATCC 11539 / FP-39264 / Madison 617) TaxID=670483 RepID=S7RYP5_GLOTA|nr:RCC1/BLIP-II protein [Gloeophyllum trabeum ATCC 11539]EPQ60060.1 RCC1/BLIP-II protein [Gloeophyllum trabeum ATCC 11539]